MGMMTARGAKVLAVLLLGMQSGSAWAAVGELPVLQPPALDYAKICRAPVTLTKDTHHWSGWDGKASPLSGRELVDLGRLYLYGSMLQASDPALAFKLLTLAADKPGKHRGSALYVLADAYAKGLGTAQDSVMEKQTLEEALKLSARGAGYALGTLYEKEGEFTKAANAYARDAALNNPAAALALSILYKTEKVPVPSEGAANETVALAQNMMLQSLANGNCSALNLFGSIYLRGEIVPRDESTAAKWLEAAAEGKTVGAMLTLASLYQIGIGVPQDQAKVTELWERAASLGSSEAMYHLGFSYLFGDYVEKDVNKAIPWLEKAASRYDLESTFLLYRIYRGDYGSTRNPELAMKWLQKAAEHPAAKTSYIFELGRAYEDGALVTRDYAKALDYYQQAAKLGDEDAPFRVGILYQRALGTSPEPKLALRFYRLAASRGNKEAMMALYRNYQCGISVPYSEEKSKRWLDRAVANASFAGIILSQQFYQNAGGEENMLRAKELLNQGVDLDSREAMITLATLYLHGAQGIEKDEAKANELLERAISPGEDRPQGLTNRANLVLKGRHAPEDEKMALEWLQEAADLKNSEAYRSLGSLYLNGLGNIPADRARGLQYLKESAALGNSRAMLMLAETYLKYAANDEEKAEALQWYKEAGLHGDARAALWLAEWYHHAEATQENKQASAEWLTRLQSPESCGAVKSVLVAKVFSQGTLTQADPEKASEWFTRALRTPVNNFAEMEALVEAYSEGYGTEKDETKALQWEKRSAELGEVKSMRRLARRYAEGRGSPKNAALAQEWLERAAAFGDLYAYMDLGKMYVLGQGVERDLEKANGYYTQAAEQNLVVAMRALGDVAMQQGNQNNAVQWFEKAADKGDSPSIFRLITLYSDAASSLHDEQKTTQWVQKAIIAAQNDPVGMARIGEAYQKGLGVSADPAAAVQWFVKSADAGSAMGMRLLAKAYLDGNGIAQDREQASNWYLKAAEKGDLSAMVAIANAYATGSGVPRDNTKSSRFYQLAAQKGSTRAMREMGFIFLQGRGVPRNESAGIEWLNRAAERGDFHAMEELARSYAAGFGVEESSREALEWWKRAAAAGSPIAKDQLETAIETGYAPASFVKE